MAEAAFNVRNNFLFPSKFDLSLKKRVVDCYIWSVTLNGAGVLGTTESRTEIVGKF